MDNNSLNLLISAILDPKGKDQILKDIQNIQEQVNKTPLKFKVDIDSAEFKQFSANLQKISGEMSKALNLNIGNTEIQKVQQYFEGAEVNADKLYKTIEKTKVSIGEYKILTTNINTETKEETKNLQIISDNNEKIKEQGKLISQGYDKQEQLLKNIYSIKEKLLKLNPQDNSNEITQLEKILQLQELRLTKTQTRMGTSGLSDEQKQIELLSLETELRDKLLLKEYQFIDLENKKNIKISQTELYQQQENSLNRIFSLSKQKIDAENKGYTELSLKLKEQIDLENQKYILTRQDISKNNLVDKTKENDLLNKEIKLQQDLNSLSMKYDEIARQETIELEKQIALYKEQLAINIKNAQTTYSQHLSSSGIEGVLSKADTINVINYKDAIKDTNLEFDKVVSNARAARKESTLAMKESDNFLTTLSKDFGKMIAWTVVGTALFGSFREIKEGIDYVSQLDNALNEIRIVTGQNQEQVQKLAKSYNELARSMSVTTKEIAQTAADLYRQGLNTEDANERMQAIIKYAKISSISLQESNKIITATMNATGESAQKVIDIFAYLGDMTAAGAEEIGESLQRVASASENSGLSLEKTASWLATISSITRESSSTIGRSLNSLISRYEQIKEKGFNEEDATKINDVTKALDSISIVATDSLKQLRPIADVLDELGNKWDTLTKNEKSYLSTTLGGTYQRNRLITLLDNYNISLKNYEYAMNAAGSASQKFTIYQDSVQAKLDSVRASWEGFWQKSINSDVIKDVLTALSHLINGLDNLGNVILIISGLFITFKSKAIIDFGKTIASSITNLLTLTSTTTKAAGSLKLLNLAFTTFAPLTIALGIMAITKAFDALYISVDEQKQKVEELTTKYNNLVEEIEKLRNIKAPTEGQKANLILLERELKLQDELLKKEKERLMQKEVFGKSVFGGGLAEETSGLISSIKSYSEFIKKASETRKMFQEGNTNLYGINLEQFNEQVKNISDVLIKYEKRLLENRKVIQEYVDTLGKDAPKELITLRSEIDNILPSLQNINGSLNKNSESIQQNNKEISNFTYNIENLNKDLDDVQSSLKDLASLYNQVYEGQKLSSDQMLDLIQEYPQILSYMDIEGNLIISQKDLLKTLFELKKQDMIITLQTEKDKVDAVINSLEQQRQAYLNFYKAINIGSKEQAAQMFGFDLSKYEGASQASKDLQAKINALGKVSFKDYDTKTKSTKGIDFNQQYVKEYNAEVDKLDDKLKILNSEYKALQDKNANVVELNKKQDKIIGIQKEKQIALNNAVSEMQIKKEAVGSQIKALGIDPDATQDAIDKSFKKLSSASKTKFNELYTDYKQLGKGISDNIVAGFESKSTLDESVKEKLNNIYDEAKRNADKLSLSLEELKTKYDALGNNDFAAKQEINNQKIAKAQELTKFWNSELEKFKDNPDIIQKIKEEIAKYDEITVKAKDDTKDLAKSLIKDVLDAEKQLDQNKLDNAEKGLNNYKKEHQIIIDGYQKQIDALQDKADLEDEGTKRAEYLKQIADATLVTEEEKTETLKKQADIQKQLELIATIEREKNVRIYHADANGGKGGFVWESNPRDLREAQEKLAEMQTDFNDYIIKQALDRSDKLKNITQDYQQWELEQSRKHEKQKLENAINAEQALIKIQEDAFELQKTAFEEQWNNIDILSQNLFDKYKDNLNNAFSELQPLLDKLNSELKVSTSATLPNNINSSNNSSIITEMKSNASAWGNASPEEKIRLSNRNLELGTSIGWTRDTSGVWHKPDGTRAFDDGGKAFGKGFILKDTVLPERILSPEQTKSFDKLVDYLPKIFNFNPQPIPILANSNGEASNTNISIQNLHVDAPANYDSMRLINNIKRMVK